MQPLEVEIRPGVVLGHKHIPVNRVGSYIPGGRYPMFGSAQMSIIPAKVAGVKIVVACTPPVKGEGFYPATINAMKAAGADRIFVLGGVPAMAMMAFGLGGVEPVDVLCGAGNKFVAEAKRQLFGRCGIDLLAGPTEIAIIADDSADPALVACDLLGQAEHDPDSGVYLICMSERLRPRRRSRKWRSSWPSCRRATSRRLSWRDNGIVYVADDLDEAIRLSDDYAPEHLELHVEKETERLLLDRLTNYGSLFIGEETTVAYGDKSIGTNHILPDQPRGALHRRRVGRQVPQDLHVPAHDAGGQPRGRRGDRAAVQRRADARPRHHRPRPRRAICTAARSVVLRACVSDRQEASAASSGVSEGCSWLPPHRALPSAATISRCSVSVRRTPPARPAGPRSCRGSAGGARW